MKSLTLLCYLVLVAIPVWADDATTNAAPAAVPAPLDERAAAIAINKSLMEMLHGGDSSEEKWGIVDKELYAYRIQYGVTPQTTHNLVLLRQLQLAVAKQSGIAGRYDALLNKLANDPTPEVAALVAKIVALKTKPIDLQFTAVDGTAVDLAKLRGKVVLLDFWATWCPPCVGEVPNVVAAYQKLHEKGFEIVGISLDKDKDAMQAFTKQHGMTWPQYFDGKVWKNDISTSYGIGSIPAMWLFDKKGMLVTTDGREGLEDQVEKLLASP